MRVLMSCLVLVVLIAAAALGVSSCGHNGRMEGITLFPANASIIPGTSQTFQAQGYLSDGATYFLSQVNWSMSSSSSVTIATIDPTLGLAVASSNTGTVTITGADPYSAFTGTTSLSVALLSSVTISPYLPNVTPGASHQFYAIGYLANSATQDLTSFVTWTTDNPAVATVYSVPGALGNGTVYTISGVTGTTNIIASGVTSDGTNTIPYTYSTLLTVNPVPLATLTLTPQNPTISMATAMTQQFSVTGTFAASTPQLPPLDWASRTNWTSSNPAVATIDPFNPAALVAASINYITVTIVGTGTTAITATDPMSGIAASTTLTVTQ